MSRQHHASNVTTTSRRASVTVEDHERVAVVTVTGELDACIAPEVEHKVRAAAHRRPLTLVLDLGEVTFVDLTALRMLAALRRSDVVGSMLVVVSSPAVDRVRALVRRVRHDSPVAPVAA